MKKLHSLWLLMFVLMGAELTATAAMHSVVVSGLTFSPKDLRVTNGDTVVWTGLASFHTVTPNADSTEPFCGGTAQASCTVTFLANGSFGYHCIPHASFGMTGVVTVVAAPAAAPSVSITNPPDNALFAAPAAVSVGVSAIDADGSVTSVQLLTNGVTAQTSTTPPFGFSLTSLSAGNYVLRARATDNQSLSATSTPVNIRVADLPLLSFSRGTNGPIQLQFNTVTGVNYVIERGMPLTNFAPLITNPGSGGAILFSETNGDAVQKTYRLRLQ
jgi:plastocyanin